VALKMITTGSGKLLRLKWYIPHKVILIINK
jgi:hypothetical protein